MRNINFYAGLVLRRPILAPTNAPITDKMIQALRKIKNVNSGLEYDTLISENITNALQIRGVYQILFGCVLQIIKQAAGRNIT
jgi:hypothetical protein